MQVKKVFNNYLLIPVTTHTQKKALLAISNSLLFNNLLVIQFSNSQFSILNSQS